MPKRSGCDATTIVLNSTFGSAGAWTSTVLVSTRAFAWLFSQKSAAKIDTAPNTAAMPIMVIALFFTPLIPLPAVFFCWFRTLRRRILKIPGARCVTFEVSV